MAMRPAWRKAMSEESTEWYDPSISVTATSTTGKPPSVPRCRKSDTPISTDGMNERGTTPPVIFSSNWKPEPRGSGLMSSTTSPNWP
jgi:hypothetical protein